MPQVKWLSKVYYVDIDTGEVITKRVAFLNYRTIGKHKYYERTGNAHGIVTITNKCRRTGQLQIFKPDY